MSRFQFVADHSDTFEVKRLCQVTDVSRSSYYAWSSAAEARAARVAADAELAEQIRAVHEADNTCGRPRITAEINDGKPADQRINHKRIGRVMRANGIQGLRLRRKHRTTIPEPADAASKDLLNRDFRTFRISGSGLAGCESEAACLDCRGTVGRAAPEHARAGLQRGHISVAISPRPRSARGGLAGRTDPPRTRTCRLER